VPPNGFVKMNTDRNFYEGDNCMDDQGKWLSGFALHEIGGNPLLTRAFALRERLRGCAKLGLEGVGVLPERLIVGS
jgi:hypothetical protein